MFQKLLKNNIFLTIIVSIVVFGIIVLLTKVFYTLDKTFSDSLHQNFVSQDFKASNNIIIVGIDEKTVSSELGRFPFSRDSYIPVIENLNALGASVIGFDIIFADKTSKEIDGKFAQAVKKAGNIFLGGGTLEKKGKDGKYISLEKPYSELFDAGLGVGYFSPILDAWNKKVYALNATTHYPKDNTFPHFAIGIIQKYYSILYNNGKNFEGYPQEDESYFYIKDGVKVPVYKKNSDGTSQLLINYVESDKFKSYSFIDIYNNNGLNPEHFKDSIVLVGATADGIKDIFDTPIGQTYGVMTHANMINTVLTKKYKLYFDKNLELLLLFTLIILGVYFNLSISGKRLFLSNLGVASIFGLLLWFIVDVQTYLLNYPAEFIFALILSLTVSNILKSFIEDKNKTKLNQALSQYVSHDIAEEILHGAGKVNLNGERKYISIFFSDIEGFTSISEKMNPEELVVFLREYLGAMSNVIMDQRGLIDKYEGDAIMALWGVFGHEEASTYDNCISALKQQQRLKVLNKDWKERFGEELKIRMGLHTGEAIVGNIGAEGRKMEFTALGDSVNLASRLEEVNKKYGTYLCVSDVVYTEQKDNFEFRYLDKIRVKGKTIPLSIYEMLSRKGKLSDFKTDIVSKFNGAINLYLNKEFEKAQEIFKDLSLLGDAPSKTYIERCDIYLKNPPEDNWDGVWTMKTK